LPLIYFCFVGHDRTMVYLFRQYNGASYNEGLLCPLQIITVIALWVNLVVLIKYQKSSCLCHKCKIDEQKCGLGKVSAQFHFSITITWCSDIINTSVYSDCSCLFMKICIIFSSPYNMVQFIIVKKCVNR
jgi:hypothetical protein